MKCINIDTESKKQKNRIKSKKLKSLIVVIIILLILSGIATVASIHSKRMNLLNMDEIGFSYEVTEYSNEIFKILIKVTDKINGLKQIEIPDGNIIYCNEQKEVGLDFIAESKKEYKFKITSSNGEEIEKTINLSLTKPEIEITEIGYDSIKVNVTNVDKNINAIKYDYYIDGNIKIKDSESASEIIDNLETDTNYKIKVILKLFSTNLESDEVNTKTKAIMIEDAVDYWPMQENLENNAKNSTAGSLLLKGSETPKFDNNGIYLTGQDYIQTADNYKMPDNFTIMMQVRNLVPIGRIIGLLGQGDFSNYEMHSGRSNTFYGIQWDNYYPLIRIINADYSEKYGGTTDVKVNELKEDKWSTIVLVKKNYQSQFYINDELLSKGEGTFRQLNEPLSISRPVKSNDDGGWTTNTYMNGYYRNLIVFNGVLSKNNIKTIISQF